jgi:hypothetical protein
MSYFLSGTCFIYTAFWSGNWGACVKGWGAPLTHLSEVPSANIPRHRCKTGFAVEFKWILFDKVLQPRKGSR